MEKKFYENPVTQVVSVETLQMIASTTIKPGEPEEEMSRERNNWDGEE